MTAVSEAPVGTRVGEPQLLLFRRDRVERLDGLDDIPRRLDSSSLLWVDLRRPSEDAVRRLADRLEFDDQAGWALRRPSATPDFRDGGTFVHVTARAPGGTSVKTWPSSSASSERTGSQRRMTAGFRRSRTSPSSHRDLAPPASSTARDSWPRCWNGCSTSTRWRSSASRWSSRSWISGRCVVTVGRRR